MNSVIFRCCSSKIAFPFSTGFLSEFSVTIISWSIPACFAGYRVTQKAWDHETFDGQYPKPPHVHLASISQPTETLYCQVLRYRNGYICMVCWETSHFLERVQATRPSLCDKWTLPHGHPEGVRPTPPTPTPPAPSPPSHLRARGPALVLA